MHAASQASIVVAAAGVAFFHSVLGPDHYLPFIAMGRSLHWSRTRLAIVTVLCGLGHVFSSLLLGLLGIALGFSLIHLQALEAGRGSWAAWALIAFGLTYCLWGVARARRGHAHHHLHWHSDGTAHTHEHAHQQGHLHPHLEDGKQAGWQSATPWMLFTIFLLGPCEPMIPLFMYPAASQDWAGAALVAGVFTVVTVATMLAIVLGAEFGLQRVRIPSLEPYSHAIAGATIAICGMAIVGLGV